MSCDCITNNKPIVILWSGGLDSTLCLYNACKHFPTRRVIAVSVHVEAMGPNKMKREQTARKKIREYFNSMHLNFQHMCIKVCEPVGDVDYALAIVHEPEYSFSNIRRTLACQPLFFIPNLLPFFPQHCELWISNIRDDSEYWMIKHDVDSMINHMAAIAHKQVNIHYPLQYFKKWEVLEAISLSCPDVLELFTSCENTTTADNCGYCTPCVNLRNAVLEWEQNSSIRNVDNYIHMLNSRPHYSTEFELHSENGGDA